MKLFRIYLPEYWISKNPVTFAVYRRFIKATPEQAVPYIKEDWAEPYNWEARFRSFPADKAEHPIVQVSWYDAVAFCKWAGLQLPTEEQWEKAARGTDERIYPWGDNEPTDKLLNFNDNVGGTTPVGHYSPQGDSPYGCVDMSGNVLEWCMNKYNNPEDVAIDESGAGRILRGGSWFDNKRSACTGFRYSNHPLFRNFNIGWRVVVCRPSF